MASDILRGIIFWLGLGSFATLAFVLSSMSDEFLRGLDTGGVVVVGLFLLVFVPLGIFFLRLDLRLPKDRPIRFNRRQGKVYANDYTWSHNPFGRWGGGVKVFDWNTLQAEVTKQTSASGEVVTQRYALDLVACKPGTLEEVDRFRLQQGAMTTRQYEEHPWPHQGIEVDRDDQRAQCAHAGLLQGLSREF